MSPGRAGSQPSTFRVKALEAGLSIAANPPRKPKCPAASAAEMVAAIATAPAPASALRLIGAALDAAATRFEEVREFAGQRHRIIASSHELRERELIKAASLAAAMAGALRARGLSDAAADLTALTCTTVMHVSFVQWVDDPDKAPFRLIAKGALAQLREIATAG
jgi:hypothetical protein